MLHRLLYHPDVSAVDLPSVNLNLARRILRAIEHRLTAEPAYYGEPLRHRLKGYWKLRVGDYRIIYRIVGQEVWIYRIGHRREVYAISFSRLSWRPS